MKPGGLRHRALTGETSACELVLAVDQFRVFAFTSLRAGKEVDLLRDDLAAVAIGAGCVGPLRVVDTAVDEDLHALFAVLCYGLAEAVEAGDAVPFGVHDPVAVLVAHHATFREARPRGGQGEVGDLGSALCAADLGLLTDVAGEDDDVLHVKLLYLAEGTIPSTRPE
jgi:hypothetical protein